MMRIRSLAQSLVLAAGAVASAAVAAGASGCVAAEDPSLLTGGPPRYGSGANGPLDTGGNNNTVTINRTRTTVVGAAGSSQLVVGASGGFAPEQLVLLHDSQGAGAGRWELARVFAVATGSLTVTRPLAHDYPATDHAQVLVVPQYTDVSVRNGDNLTGPNWAGGTGGIVAFTATGTVTVAGSLYQSAAGFRGAAHDGGCPMTYQCLAGASGESTVGPSLPSSAANGAGGGGGGVGECNGGGGGSYGAPGTRPTGGASDGCAGSGAAPGAPGSLVGDGDLGAAIFFGGAGGEGGGDDDSVAPGAGGNGGGIVMIWAPQIVVSGHMDVNGGDGNDGVGGNGNQCASGCGSGGGGGGAGGAIYFDTPRLTISGTVTALGGKGGACSCTPMSALAGAGGSGRIAARGATLTGVTNPPLVGL